MRAAAKDISDSHSNRTRTLLDLAGLFLKLGTIAFGGPAAHIAMMEDEVVRRRGWLSHDEFLDLVGATNLIPGPNSTEMAIHVGRRRGGVPGLLVAGVCFIMPAALMVGCIAWAYTWYGRLPEVSGLLYGIKPVIIAIVVQALWRLGRTAVKTGFLGGVGVVAAALNFLGVNELLILFATAAFVALTRNLARHTSTRPPVRLFGFALPVPLLASAGGVTGTSAAPFGLWPLFCFFLKVGAVLFGSGYVLLAFLRADLVDRWHWLTDAQLLDAIAVGQITPGPVFTTATFIGFILAGWPGATLATVGIFLPAFIFVAISGPLVPRLRRSRVAGDFLDGLNVASLSLMAVVTWQLGRDALVDIPTLLLAGVSFALLAAFRLNSTCLVLGGAILGLLLRR
jgi:chromate transporter